MQGKRNQRREVGISACPIDYPLLSSHCAYFTLKLVNRALTIITSCARGVVSELELSFAIDTYFLPVKDFRAGRHAVDSTVLNVRHDAWCHAARQWE